MSELESLKAVVDAAAANVVKLKGEGADPSAIKGAVGELLAAKAAYAEKNGGIGVDGKPFDPSGGKKDKKKKSKDAAPAAKPQANAENAAKKAAKKAEAKAKKDAAKAAAKAGGGKDGGGGGGAPAAKKDAAKPPSAPATAPTGGRVVKKKGKAAQFGKVEPLQLCFSPNDGAALPFVTLMCAVLTGLDPDLKLKMDINRAAAPALGTHGTGTTADKVISGDITCAKYFLNTHQRTDLVGGLTSAVGGFMGQAEVDQWIEYALKCKGASRVTSFGQGWGEVRSDCVEG